MIYQPQLLKTASYDSKKKRYYVDLTNGKVGEVYVDDKDIIIKTKGFGAKGHVLRNNAFTGKSFVQEYFREKNDMILENIISKGSSSFLPMIIQKQIRKVSFTIYKKNIGFIDKCIRNLIKSGYEVVEGIDRIYCYSEYVV
jgi:malate/lactate dehydrogenase